MDANAIDEVILRQIEVALMEDVGPGDITTRAAIKDGPIKARIIAKSAACLAGLPVTNAVFQTLDKTIKIRDLKKDGDRVSPGDVIAEYDGNARVILTGERTALNYLGHLSGIATLTAKFVGMVEGTGAMILDTRKTTPGLRYLEKYAVTCGGGANHRFGLYDMVLIKDNHIACGSITKAVKKVKAFAAGEEFEKNYGYPGNKLTIEIEVVNEAQLKEAVACGVTRLLLDNQSPEQLASLVKAARSLADNLKLEASGNVSLETVRQIAETGIDYISIGALTHSAPSSDFSLNIIS
ncbi:MAG: carboxylating nicotinate-nucleotide diphosphorylase [Candidatus Zixiibacteriota bacterium]|nr:MAG: carboxylating nicotinate-nucleotide diphosphorylase [candidate division Zixibacteria bacterium]